MSDDDAQVIVGPFARAGRRRLRRKVAPVLPIETLDAETRAKIEALLCPRRAPADPLRDFAELRDVAIVGADALLCESRAPVAWRWHGIVQACDSVEVAGPPYCGKSTLTFLLAVAAANPTGCPIALLGHEVAPIESGKFVVLANVENSPRSAARALEAACELLGLPVRETLDRIILVPRTSNAILGQVRALGRSGAIGLTVIDSRARALRVGGHDANSEDDQAEIANAITELVRASGAPVVVVSHLRKCSGPRGEPTLDDVAGSHQRVASADVVLLVWCERDADDAVVVSFVKVGKRRDDGGEAHPARMSFSIGSGDDGRAQLSTDGSARASDAPVHERIYELLRRDGEMGKTAIRDALRVQSGAVERGLTVLFRERRVAKHSTTIAGRKRWLFAARQGAEALDGIVAPARGRTRK